MKLFQRLSRLLFPPKCVLCRGLLTREETDLCRKCRTETEEYPKPKSKLPFLAGWTALWHYSGSVRASLLRYKFHNARSYADTYGRLLAMKVTRDLGEDFDLLTWVPISAKRKRKRGYDQVELLASALGRELNREPVATLVKFRHTPPQSGIAGAPQRRANVLGAYRPIDPARFQGKRVLLLDDILTTGATAGECARVLLTAGAKEVICAAVAAVPHQRNKQ